MVDKVVSTSTPHPQTPRNNVLEGGNYLVNHSILQFVWIVVFLATVLLGVDLGLGVGVAFSLAVIIIRTIL